MLKHISILIEKIFGKEIKNKLKCYYRSLNYKNVKLKYNKGLISYNFPDDIVVKSVDFFDEDPLKLINGYMKYYIPKKNDVVVDAGAFLGAFSIYLAKKYPKIKIIAFEPEYSNYIKLLKNIKTNNVNNIRVIKKGLWDSANVKIITSRGPEAMISNNINEGKLIKVIDLDYELKNIGIKKVNFIKMDIEGSEIEALAGMKNTLSKFPKLAIASYHIRKGQETHKIISPYLKKLGYLVNTGYPKHLTTWAKKLN